MLRRPGIGHPTPLPARTGENPQQEQKDPPGRPEEDASLAMLPGRFGAELHALGGLVRLLGLKGPEVEEEVARRLIAVGGILLERAEDERADLRGDFLRLRKSRRIVFQNG